MTTTPPDTRRRTSLAQMVAIAAGVKTRTERALTEAYHAIQKPAPFTGIARTYRPRDEDGDQYSPERTEVQVRSADLVDDVATAFTRMLDVVATIDASNTHARADLVVDGVVLLEAAPVTYLMWLEKQVVLMRSFIGKLPVLDLAERWDWDQNAQAWASAPTEATKTKKVPRSTVLYEATPQHPAQIREWHEDVIAGYWTSIKYSGAIPAARVFDMLDRVDRLVDAIRKAREEANSIEVVDVKVGDKICNYLFQP
jgi:hypothetical protein